MDAGKPDIFCSVRLSRRTVTFGGSRLMKIRRRTLPRAAAARVGARLVRY